VARIWQQGGSVGLECPGCGGVHVVPVVGSGAWTWNQSLEKPTLHPSLKVTNGQGWCCHFWIKDGRIQFLDDCTHELRSKTIDLPELSAQS
jgi:hypothetical protein